MSVNVTSTHVPGTTESFFHEGADVTLGVLHLLFGVMAIVGNGVVFGSFLKHATVRSSACMFVQLAVAGVIVGYTSLYTGVYLIRGRHTIPADGTALHKLGVSVGHTWWFGFICTIMLVTTLSVIRAWSIARPFKYKTSSSRIFTIFFSLVCWAFGFSWITARYIIKCRWVLQPWFSHAQFGCYQSNQTPHKVIVIPFDVFPLFCASVVTTFSNTYVITELAKTHKTTCSSKFNTNETFTKTTLIIISTTSLFLICYSPTVVFFILNCIEILSDGRYSVTEKMTPSGFIYTFAMIHMSPTIYPALSPLLQFMGMRHHRQKVSVRKNTVITMLSKRSSRIKLELIRKKSSNRSMTAFETLNSPLSKTHCRGTTL